MNTKIKKYKLNLKNILESLIVLICIMLTDTVTLFYNRNSYTIFVVIIGIVIIFKYFLKKKKFILYQYEIFYLFLPIIFIFFSQIINLDISLGYEYKIILLLLGYIFAKTISWENFIERYINWITFITFFSLSIYILTFINDSWYIILPETNNGDNYSLIFTTITKNKANSFRNFGPFWEPGVFQIYINFALIFQIYREKKEKLWKNVILILGIISTFSTTGYICFCFIIIIYFMEQFLEKIKKKYFIFLFFSIVCGILILKNSYIQNIVFSKFNSSNGSSASFLIRLMDIKMYLKQWLEYPIFGQGITNSYSNAVLNYKNSQFFHFAGSTSTTLREFACFGICVGISRLLLQWNFCKMFTKNKISRICIFIVIMIFLNTEDLIYSIFMSTIFYYAITEKKGRKKI